MNAWGQENEKGQLGEENGEARRGGINMGG